MAKQASILPITGTINNITFYRRDGNYYCKKKSKIAINSLNSDQYESYHRRKIFYQRCFILAAFIYRLMNKKNNKIYQKIVKWTCTKQNNEKDLYTMVNFALLQFGLVDNKIGSPARKKAVEQFISTLPFSSLVPSSEEIKEACKAQKIKNQQKASRENFLQLIHQLKALEILSVDIAEKIRQCFPITS